jgi:hypothetical protein
MALPGNSSLPLIFFYPGNPTNVSTTIINPPLGSLIIDYSTPAMWQKTTAAGDNSGYSGGAGSTLTAPLISGGLTASGSAANTFAGSTGTFITSTGANTLSGTTTVAANKNLLCAAGTSTLDFSLGTGIFKSPTGLNTFGGKAAFKVVSTPVAATGAGGGVAGAAALGSANIVNVSSDGATKGVKLNTGVPGDVVWITNTSATACNLFAASGGTINGGSADVGCAIAASKGVLCQCMTADVWIVSDFTARAGAAA